MTAGHDTTRSFIEQLIDTAGSRTSVTEDRRPPSVRGNAGAGTKRPKR